MKAKTTGTYVLIAAAAVIAGIFCFNRGAAPETVYPVEKAKRSIVEKIGTRIGGFFHGASAAAENRRLKREVAALALVQADAERLEVENARLRRALEYKAKNPEMWLAAGVLSEGGASAGARNTLRVDKGISSGIREGAVVVVPEGLVGRVISVTEHTSEVLLITDPSLKVSCEIELGDGSSPLGVLAGGTEECLVLKHLKSSAELPPRSRVLTSGIGGVFPKGIEVGTLLSVRGGKNERKIEGEVQPTVDFSNLEDVFIRREK